MASYTPKSPNYKPSWPGMRLGDGQNTLNAVETTTQTPSDHAAKKDHFSGVVRYARDFRKYLISNLFGPSLDSCDPSILDPDFKTKIYLTGRNFNEGSLLYVNGVLASSGTFITDDRMSFVAPASEGGAESPITFILIRPDGKLTEASGLAAYEVSPTLTSVYPSGAYTHGGTDSYVEMQGASFKQNSIVQFMLGTGSYSSSNVTWRSAQQLDVFPPKVPNTGSYSLKVISPSGLESNIISGFDYQYAPPVLSYFFPPVISTDGGELVELYGSDFLPGAKIWFGSAPSGTSGTFTQAATTFVDENTLRFVPPSASGSGDYPVYIKNDDAPYNKTSSIQYLKRVVGLYRVYGAAPTSGIAGTQVVVSGANFSSSVEPDRNVQSVRFGSTQTTFTFTSGSVTASTPDLGTTQKVTVYLSGSPGEVLALQSYQFVAPAILTSVSPTSGSVVGGNSATLVGSKFLPQSSATLRVGGIETSFTVNADGTQMYFVMPSHEVGGVNFSVDILGIASTVSTFAYAYTSASSIAENFLPSPGNFNDSSTNVE